MLVPDSKTFLFSYIHGPAAIHMLSGRKMGGISSFGGYCRDLAVS